MPTRSAPVPAATMPGQRALLEAERELCKRPGGFAHFVRLAWPIVEPGAVFRDNWHVHAICRELEAIARGENRHLIVTVPPGCGKSILACVMFDAWVWTFRPEHKFLYTSFDASLTRRDGGKTLQIVTSDWYRARWGHVFGVPADSAHSEFYNDRGGMRFASSVNGKTTGYHPHTAIVDDSIKPRGVNEKSLTDVIDWWKNTMISRAADPATVSRVIIQQRLAENDLPGYLLREEGDKWRHLDVPLLWDGPREGSALEDPRTVYDTCFWPERFPSDVVGSMRRDLGPRVFSAQYQQRPAPEEGLIFRQEWFAKRWTVLPAQIDQWLQSWDMTFKGSDGSDYVVGQVWAKSGAEFFLVDQVRGKWSFTETCQAVVDLSAKWPQCRRKLIENKANGPAVENALSKRVTGLVLVEPQGGKVARANAVTGLYEAGNVHLPDGTAWISDWVAEHCAFPTAVHDDQVDAASQALTYLSQKNTTSYAAVMKGAGALFG